MRSQLLSRKLPLSPIVIALLTGILVTSLHAQVTATISGTVTDISGAAVPQAAVQVKNTGTDVIQSATTDSQGRFIARELPIGTYEVQAAKQGFQTVVRPGVTLTVGSQTLWISHCL